MKKLLSILLSIAFYFAPAQNFSVSAEKTNIFYVGVDNPFSILVENYPASQVVAKTTIGEVYGSGKIRLYRGFLPGYASIILYKEDGITKIGSSNFMVKYVPAPVAKVGPSAGGSMSKAILADLQNLRAELENFEYDIRFDIDSFTFNIIRTDTCYFKELINIGGKFSNDIREALQGIKKNDVVIFRNIYAKGADQRSLLLYPVVFTIID